MVEQNYVFEVLAREGHRVDKVLVLTTKTAGTNPKSADAVDSSDALNVHPPSARCRNPRPRPNLATPRQQRDRAGATTSPSKTSSNPVAAPPSANPSSSKAAAPARKRCESAGSRQVTAVTPFFGTSAPDAAEPLGLYRMIHGSQPVGDLRHRHPRIPRLPPQQAGDACVPSVSSATTAASSFSPVAQEVASCISNASTKDISCSTLATIRRCSARGGTARTVG